MLTRLPVARKRDLIVTPIENAIEDVKKRNDHIATEVNRKPVNPKTLTQVLQGSALPQVNEGALAICKIFLSNHFEHPKEHVERLCLSLNIFLDYIRMGLAHNKQLISSDHDKRFHFEMEAGFKQLEAEIKEYIHKINIAEKSDDLSSESNFTEHDDDTEDGSEHETPRRERKRGRKRCNTLSVPATSHNTDPTKKRKDTTNPSLLARSMAIANVSDIPPTEELPSNILDRVGVGRQRSFSSVEPSSIPLSIIPPKDKNISSISKAPIPKPLTSSAIIPPPIASIPPPIASIQPPKSPTSIQPPKSPSSISQEILENSSKIPIPAPISAPIQNTNINSSEVKSTPKKKMKLPAHKKPPPPSMPPPE